MLLISDAPGALLRALSALPGSQVQTLSLNQYLASTSLPAIDMIIFEGAAPGGSLPSVPALVVNPGPGANANAGMMPAPVPTRLLAQDPVLTGVDLAGVTFGQVPIVSLGPDDVEIAGADGGPLIYRTHLANGEQADVLMFDIEASNLPVRVAFPILVSNLVSDLVAQQIPASLSVGDPITISPHAGAKTLEITDPSGTAHTMTIEADRSTGVTPVQSYEDTGMSGPYWRGELDTNGSPITMATIMVNAGHPQESNLAPNPLLKDALASSAIETDQSRLRNQFELWPLVVAAVLGLLLIEWLLTLRQERRRPAAGSLRA